MKLLFKVAISYLMGSDAPIFFPKIPFSAPMPMAVFPSKNNVNDERPFIFMPKMLVSKLNRAMP